eukprot:487359-Rhodomonas_salina.2
MDPGPQPSMLNAPGARASTAHRPSAMKPAGVSSPPQASARRRPILHGSLTATERTVLRWLCAILGQRTVQCGREKTAHAPTGTAALSKCTLFSRRVNLGVRREGEGD